MITVLQLGVALLVVLPFVLTQCGNRCPNIANEHVDYCNKYYYVTSNSNNDLCPCQKDISVAYLEYPPYIYTGSDGNARGIWKEMIEQRTKIFCRTSKAEGINWINKNSDSIQNSLDLVQNGGGKFAIPVVAPEDVVEQFEEEWSPLQEIDGVAYVTIKPEEWKMALEKFGSSVVDVWPFFLLVVVAAMTTGIVIWLLDTRTNEEDFPSTFVRGSYEGFWWSFVSMTTVGYGDKVPKSAQARIFSVFWIILGITIVGILTSMLSSGFTDSVTVEEELMKDKNIGYLDVTTHEEQVIVREAGIPVAARNIDDLVQKLAVGEIHGFAMDSRQLMYYYKTEFSKIPVEFRMQRVYPFPQYFGLAFYRVYSCDIPDNRINPLYHITANDWHGCHEKFYEKNKRFQQTINGIAVRTEQENLDSTFLEHKTYTASIFDTSSDQFWRFLQIIGVILLCLVIIGSSYDLFIRYYGDKIGVSVNKGYDKKKIEMNELNKITNSTTMTKEEKSICDLVERTVHSAEIKMREAENSVKFDIKEMSRTIRQEMLALKKRVDLGQNNYSYHP